MTALPLEVGHVVGWTVILDQGGSHERRIEGITLNEWQEAIRQTDVGNEQGMPLGGTFFTRIQTPSEVVECPGANPKITPGTKMFLYECHKCGKQRDWYYRECTYCTCEKCSPDY